MSDLVSRADAIGAVHEYYQKRFTENSKWDADAKMLVLEDKTIAKDNMEICNIIKALPSAELPKGELISRADAIERIVNDNVVGGMDRVNEYRNSNEHNDYLDAISTAIATVDDIPSAETHEIRTETHGVCSDLISRADAIDAIDDAIDADSPQWAILRTKIGFLPSADAVQGEWIRLIEYVPESNESLINFDGYQCSVCGGKLWADSFNFWNYCPMCGARMCREDGEA